MVRKSLRERTVANLQKAAEYVFAHSRSTSHGVDRLTVEDVRLSWAEHKRNLRQAIADNSYVFSPCRPVVIPKNRSAPISLSNSRPISVPTVRDRIVQRAMLEAVWTKIRDRVCTQASFGGLRAYRVGGRKGVPHESGKNVRHAIQRNHQFAG
jgi:retron-type reverse transcriptase